MAEAPRVLISYAHSDDHTSAVLTLADRLRSDGLDAWIDQYEQAPPAGWRAWMEDQLRRADFVLIVASERYRGRAESSGPLEVGRGVRFESTLILDDLYEAGMWNVKYVPVVLLEADRDQVPAPLRSYQRYSLYHPGAYERLLRHLTGQPATPAPPVGPRRRLPPRTRAPIFRDGEPSRSSSSWSDSPISVKTGLGLSKGDDEPETVDAGSIPRETTTRGHGPWGALSVETGQDDVQDVPPEDRPNPFDPWTPAVPPRFQGRGSELRRLEKALDTGFGVSIVGDGRIGKSSLLRTWQGRLAAAGRMVRYLDGQGSEGASMAAFVAKAVRKPAAEIPHDPDGAADVLATWVDGAGNGLRPVLLVDELDSLPERFEPRFFERLRNLIGRLVLYENRFLSSCRAALWAKVAVKIFQSPGVILSSLEVRLPPPPGGRESVALNLL